MISGILVAYAGLLSTAAVHESVHFLAAKYFNIEICEMCIGCRSLAVRVTDKLYLSPMPFGGYVVTYEDDLSSAGIVRAGVFYLLSSLANILMAAICFGSYIHTGFAALMFIGSYNLGISVYNTLPVFSSNDMNGFLNIRRLKLS